MVWEMRASRISYTTEGQDLPVSCVAFLGPSQGGPHQFGLSNYRFCCCPRCQHGTLR